MRSTGLRTCAAAAALLVVTSGSALASDPTWQADRPTVPAKAYGPGFPTMEQPAREPNGDMSVITKLSVACLTAGGIATAAALAFSADNTLNIIAGGIVPAAHPILLTLGIGGVVFATYCSIGHAVTPLVLHQFGNPEPPPGSTRPSTCRDCRDARPLPAVHETPTTLPAAYQPASASASRPNVSGVPALRAAVR